MSSAQETIQTLEQIKELVAEKPQELITVVTNINNIAVSLNEISVQQWCAQFYSELFSPENQKISIYAKQQAASVVFPSIIKLSQVQDVTVYRNVILTFTSIYEMIFDLVAKTSNGQLWDQATQLKSFILKNWNTSYPLTPKDTDTDKFRSIGCKIAAIKFIGKAITVQTSANQQSSSDPRSRSNPPGFNSNNTVKSNEISISNIPDGHQILSKARLEGEGEGLMESLLSFFKNEEFLVSQAFIAVLNTLIFIMQRRKYFSHKIFQTIANFDYNTKYQASGDSLLTYKLHKRFIARAIKNALNYSIKSGLITTSSPFNSRFAKLVSTIDSRMNEQKKRGILKDGLLDKPHKKLDPKNPFPNNSIIMDDTEYKSLYQLIDNENELANLDVSQIPHQTLVNLASTALAQVDSTKLITALTLVSQRYTDITIKTNQGLDAGTEEVKNDEEQKLQDDEDNARILDSDYDATGFYEDGADSSLQTSFMLQPPSNFTKDDKKKHLNLIINNFFQFAKDLENDELLSSFNYHSNVAGNGSESDVDNNIKISKIAINDWKKNSWLIMLSRLATRGLNNELDDGKKGKANGENKIQEPNEEFSDLIRESIFNYAMENIHERIDVVIEWLNEEWYAEFTKNSIDPSEESDVSQVPTPTYFKWAVRLLDSTIPYIEATSARVFIRLLSDLPTLNKELVYKLKSLCIDPPRTKLGMSSLMFLMMYRPPVKEFCVGLLNELKEENEELKEKSQQILDKYGS